ncbi:hypothetical protein K501DRAFT_339017, partial [Backusella circina FSU 941]
MTTTTDSVVIADRLEQQNSDIDIEGDSPLHHASFEFHFEFGSKRPPTMSKQQPKDEQQDILIEATSTYQTITDNIYIGSATGRSMAQESMPCECKIESDLDNVMMACGLDDQCINRIMFMECIVEDCPSGRLCQNRRFQKHQYANVEIMLTEKKGYGLRALEDLPTNTFIMEYVGEVIPQSEFLCRTREYDAEGYKHYYFMTLKNDEIIDATKKGCLARFMNHSCNPNCVTQKWVIGKKMRIGIFTNRLVEAGEELTFDYKFERYGALAQACFCGEPNCKGFIGASDQVDKPEYSLTYDHSSDDEYDDEQDLLNQQQPEEEDDDEEEEEENLQQMVVVTSYRPIQHISKVHAFVKRMLDSVGKPRKVNKLLMRLKATNPDNSTGREILRTIVRLHGLKLLKFWLGEWKHNEMIVKKVLEVLEMLPLANRNGLEDCKMFDIVHRFVGHDNDAIGQLSGKLLENWAHLKNVYRIPKRFHQVDTAYPPSSCKYSNESNVTCLKQAEEEEEESMEQQQVATDEPIQSPLLVSTPLPTPPSSSPSSTSKKRRYESTREFFDPDSDYFEYISIQTTSSSELEAKMKYPPQSVIPQAIPTAPRAMLENLQNQQNSIHYTQTTQHHHNNNHQHKYFKHDKQQQPTIINPSSITAEPQQSEYHPFYYDYSAYYYSLPPNWGATTAFDGSLYYYNIETGETQWDAPYDDNSTATTSDTSCHELKSAEMAPSSSLSSLSSSQQLPTPVTSTNSSVDDVDDGCLNDIAFKMEVGKIVTRYLSSMKPSLWKNDKLAFKHLARK